MPKKKGKSIVMPKANGGKQRRGGGGGGRRTKPYFPPGGWKEVQGFSLQITHTAHCDGCEKHCTDEAPVRSCKSCRWNLCWECEKMRKGNLLHNCLAQRVAAMKEQIFRKAEAEAAAASTCDSGGGSYSGNNANAGAGADAGTAAREMQTHKECTHQKLVNPVPENSMQDADASTDGNANANANANAGPCIVAAAALPEETAVVVDMDENLAGRRGGGGGGGGAVQTFSRDEVEDDEQQQQQREKENVASILCQLQCTPTIHSKGNNSNIYDEDSLFICQEEEEDLHHAKNESSTVVAAAFGKHRLFSEQTSEFHDKRVKIWGVAAHAELTSSNYTVAVNHVEKLRLNKEEISSNCHGNSSCRPKSQTPRTTTITSNTNIFESSGDFCLSPKRKAEAIQQHNSDTSLADDVTDVKRKRIASPKKPPGRIQKSSLFKKPVSCPKREPATKDKHGLRLPETESISLPYVGVCQSLNGNTRDKNPNDTPHEENDQVLSEIRELLENFKKDAKKYADQELAVSKD